MKIKNGYKILLIYLLNTKTFSESTLYDLNWLLLQSEDVIKKTLQFGKGRQRAINEQKKLGGRKSRIEEILELAEFYLEHSSIDQTIEYMRRMTNKYAQSTLYKAIKQFKAIHSERD